MQGVKLRNSSERYGRLPRPKEHSLDFEERFFDKLVSLSILQMTRSVERKYRNDSRDESRGRSDQQIFEAFWTNPDLRTPAFVYDERVISESIGLIAQAGERAGCRLLYSAKPFSFAPFLEFLSARVREFAVSSPFEARLVKESTGDQSEIHISAPVFSDKDITDVYEVCDFISFNSIRQLQQFGDKASRQNSVGLRINPQKSFIEDERYDPCRMHSKLGVPIEELSRLMSETPTVLATISGVHFHSNCDSTDFNELFDTVKHLDTAIEPLLSRVDWINIGGGYLFNEADSFAPFFRAVYLLRTKYGLTVFVEPGAAILRNAGYLVSTVLDMFESDGKTVAILDTTVNHMPEVFEYQFSPDVMGATDDGEFKVILAGCSCLAGDVFGEYAFDEPITIGARVVFENMGAYTVPKWHMFNGINLPSIYALTEDGQIVLKKQFTYADFAARNGVPTNAFI